MLNKVVRARVLRSGNGTNKDSLTIVQFSGLIWRKNVRVAGSAVVSNLAQLKHFGKMKRLFLFWNEGTFLRERGNLAIGVSHSTKRRSLFN